MISEEEQQEYIQSGKIASKVREDSKKLIMIDESLLDIAETIEQLISEEGAKCAFPPNISVNAQAAHFTPESGCEKVLGENDVVKIDLGVSLNNVLTDTAYTIDLGGKYEKLVEASEKALEEAIMLMTPGKKVGEIGAKIEETIKSFGFVPISNLRGHLIKKGLLHAGIEIPNVKCDMAYMLKEGDVFAVEPFASTGSGFVEDSEEVEVFSLINPKPLRMNEARKIQAEIITEYGLLPFAQRWLNKKHSKLIVDMTLREMVAQKIVVSYPVLKDSGDGIVSQAEHTILVGEGPIVLTEGM